MSRHVLRVLDIVADLRALDMPESALQPIIDWAQRDRVYGLCTACNAIEVLLNQATGVRDMSDIGEHHAYPTGYGCEVCS